MRSRYALAVILVLALGAALLLASSWRGQRAPISVGPDASREPVAAVAEDVALAPALEEAEGTRVSLAPPAEALVVANENGAPVENAAIRVEGSVTNEAGEALPSALVWADDAEARSDADGRYSFQTRTGKRSGVLFVFASADGHAQAQQTLMVPEHGSTVRADFHLGAAFQIRGRVLSEDGAAIDGAAVTTFFSNRNVVQSAIDGSFVLDHLEPERESHHLYARKQGWVQADTDVTARGLLVEGIELVLRRGARVDGFVLAPDGRPLPDAVLYIGFSPNAYNRLDATTNEHGAFEFPCVRAGSQTLVAQHAGFAPHKTLLEVPPDTPALPSLTLTLEAAHFIGGVVRDGAGKPLARVSISGQQDGEYIDVAGTETGSDGRFRLDGLPARGAGIEFYGEDLIRKEMRLEVLDRDDLEIVLERAARVAGRVVDAASGAPIQTFTVRFVRPALQAGEQEAFGYGATWAREGKAFTNPAGEWTSSGDELPPRSVIGVEVRAEGYAPERHYHVVPRTDFEPGDLVSELSSGGTVRGFLFDFDGAPIAGAQLRCRPEGDPLFASNEANYECGITSTASDGSFEFTAVASGSTVIGIRPLDRPMEIDGPFDVPAGGTVERTLRLGRGAAIEGLSLDAEGQPLAGAGIHLYGASDGPAKGFTARTTSDEAGRFTFRGLIAGRYQVSRLLVVGDAKVYDLITMVEVAAEETSSLELQASGSAAIEGVVRIAEGSIPEVLPIQATLHVEDGSGSLVVWGGRQPGTFPSGVVGRGTLARDGHFRFEHMPPGHWQVSVFFQTQIGQCSGSVTVDLAVGEVREISMDLRLSSER